jgi:septal ring factor EnvC (AmiA/AmiB activator)
MNLTLTEQMHADAKADAAERKRLVREHFAFLDAQDRITDAWMDVHEQEKRVREAQDRLAYLRDRLAKLESDPPKPPQWLDASAVTG